MTTTIFDLDQQRCETQAAIAEELFIEGETDGFLGVYPASTDNAYMVGYAAGCRRKLADIQRLASRLEEEAAAVEALFEEF